MSQSSININALTNRAEVLRGRLDRLEAWAESGKISVNISSVIADIRADIRATEDRIKEEQLNSADFAK